MKKGFTLVELAIVLVIVGLLIGGILVGQSMIETVKLTSQIKQIQQFDVAVNNFMTKYGQLPGDSSAMGCTNVPFCNDGKVETVGDDFPVYWEGEIANFWVHLGNSGFMPDGASFTSTISASGFNIKSPIRNSPSATFNKMAGIIVGSAHSGFGPPYAGKVVYQIADYHNIVPSALSIQDHGTPVFTPLQARMFDAKIDDGSPYTGFVFPAVVGDAPYFYFGHPGRCTDPDNYLIYGKTAIPECGLQVRVLSQSGNTLQ